MNMSIPLAIPPQIVGQLHYTDHFGVVRTDPRKIYFAMGYGEDPEGAAFACVQSPLYGSSLLPLFRSNGERLVFPGYKGLLCRYDNMRGTLRDFRQE